MSDAIANIEKRRGRPATGAKPIMVRLLPGQLGKLDAWREAQGDQPSRPEAIRRLVDRALG